MMYYLMNFIPVIISVLAFPWTCEWFGVPESAETAWGIICVCFIVFFVPAYLLFVNIMAVTKKRKKIALCLLIVFWVLVLNAAVGYLSWGLATGQMFNPDDGTIMVTHWFYIIFPMLFVMAGMGVYHIVRKVKAKKQKKD